MADPVSLKWKQFATKAKIKYKEVDPGLVLCTLHLLHIYSISLKTEGFNFFVGEGGGIEDCQEEHDHSLEDHSGEGVEREGSVDENADAERDLDDTHSRDALIEEVSHS